MTEETVQWWDDGESARCEALVLGEPCGNEAEWLLMLGCGHRSGAICSPCRRLFLGTLRRDSWLCEICGFHVVEESDVRWELI